MVQKERGEEGWPRHFVWFLGKNIKKQKQNKNKKELKKI
jgi:hypothetical protein